MLALVIFLICLGALIYIMAGYPVLVHWLARRRAKLIQRGSTDRTVSVVIAVHNGAAFISRKLDTLIALDYPRELVEIIVVCDGCTDDTEQMAARYAEHNVRILQIQKSGKPGALNVGIAAAQGEILLLTDVRQKLEPDCLRRLVSAFDDPNVGVISGELIILDSASQSEQSVSAYRKYENWIRGNLSSIDSIFGATGCLYAMRRDLAVPIPPDTLLDDMYLPLSAFFRGYRLVFDSSARAYDYPTSVEVEFGRKVRTLAGNFQIIRDFPGLLTSRNRMWLHFVSYKFGRLIMPWFFAAMVISSFFLPEPLRTLIIAGEVFFLMLVILEPLVTERFPLKFVFSLSRTFAALLAASAASIVIFFVPPQSLWKETRVAGSRH